MKYSAATLTHLSSPRQDSMAFRAVNSTAVGVLLLLLLSLSSVKEAALEPAMVSPNAFEAELIPFLALDISTFTSAISFSSEFFSLVLSVS